MHDLPIPKDNRGSTNHKRANQVIVSTSQYLWTIKSRHCKYFNASLANNSPFFCNMSGLTSFKEPAIKDLSIHWQRENTKIGPIKPFQSPVSSWYIPSWFIFLNSMSPCTTKLLSRSWQLGIWFMHQQAHQAMPSISLTQKPIILSFSL